MQFTKAEPNENFPILRFVSETGNCAADQEAFAIELLLTLTLILQGIPENVSENELQRQFPRYAYKPINRDRSWGVLVAMAGREPLPSITCPRPSCGRTSYNLADLEQRYCGCCKAFHADIAIEQRVKL